MAQPRRPSSGGAAVVGAWRGRRCYPPEFSTPMGYATPSTLPGEGKQIGNVRGAHAGDWIPALTSVEAAQSINNIVAGRNVAEILCIEERVMENGVHNRVDQAQAMMRLLRTQRRNARPHRRTRAGATNLEENGRVGWVKA